MNFHIIIVDVYIEYNELINTITRMGEIIKNVGEICKELLILVIVLSIFIPSISLAN